MIVKALSDITFGCKSVRLEPLGGDLNEEQLREIGNFGLELFDEYMKNQSERQKAELKHGSTKLLTRYCFSLCSCEIMARAFSS